MRNRRKALGEARSLSKTDRKRRRSRGIVECGGRGGEGSDFRRTPALPWLRRIGLDNFESACRAKRRLGRAFSVAAGEIEYARARRGLPLKRVDQPIHVGRRGGGKPPAARLRRSRRPRAN